MPSLIPAMLTPHLAPPIEAGRSAAAARPADSCLALVCVRYRSLELDLWLLLPTPKAVLFERATR